jgi:glutathione S-transferase
MTYTLYYSPSACSLAAHIVLREVGAKFNLELVSVRDGATSQAPYLAINPKGRVPPLAIEGESRVLTELPAILVFVARQFPETTLLPAGLMQEARCLEWITWISVWVHSVDFGWLWRPGRSSRDGAHHETLTKQGLDVITDALKDIEAQLADGRGWAVPGGYRIADPFVLVLYRWSNRIGMPMSSLCPAWTELSYRIAARSAVVAALNCEGITIEARQVIATSI